MIDSKLHTRRKLMNDIVISGLFDSTIEATSLENGLEILEAQNLDACLVGPSLSREAAMFLIKEGKRVTRSKDCAFVVVVEENNDGLAELTLKNCGAHAVITTSYSRRSFTESVSTAVRNAHTAAAKKVLNKEPFESSISDVLSDSATRLRAIAIEIENGEVNTDIYGGPTPEISGKLKAVFEDMLPSCYSGNKQKPTDPLFVGALVDFFSKRSKLSHRAALEHLRRKLIANLYRQQFIQ
jgi:hypothetical protein